MRMSTRGRFGLRSLLYLAARREPGPVSVSEIASEMEVSADYLMQLFVKFRREGILESTRGPRGGFKFTRAIDKISVGDVVRSAEGSVSPIHCVVEGSGRVFVEEGDTALCRKAGSCVSRLAWLDLTKGITNLLDSMTLADILEKGKKRKFI